VLPVTFSVKLLDCNFGVHGFVEILDLRHFSSADLRPLLEDEIATWAKLLSWDYSGSAEMILRYMDAKILPGYAAIERGSVFGYSFFVYEQNKGVIGDLFVRDGGRTPNRHEVEERLLTHVIETLQQSPGIHRVEAQLLAHDTGEVVRPFLQQGFSRHPRVFITRLRAASLVGAGISVGRRSHYRRLSRPRRCRHQRSVPQSFGVVAFSEQYRALPWLRHI
jgi:hypothetical protein